MKPLLRLEAVVIGSLFFAAASVCSAQSKPAWELSGWELTWQDEFDGSEVDTDKWEVLTRKKNHNNEKQYYLPEQATIVDGELVITTTNEPYDGKSYRSARLFSWYLQTYGRFEARAKIPTTKGIWPAIWILPRGIQWPTGGEIDIMEHRGSDSTMVSSAYHYATDLGNHCYQNSRHRPDPAIVFPDDYHLYAVEWDPGQIKFFVDGVCHKTVRGYYVSDEPMGFILNTAVGGMFDGEPNASTVFPQTFHVDYVRVWKRVGAAPKIEELPATDTGLLVNGSFDAGTKPWVAEGTVSHQAHRPESYQVMVAYEGMGYHSIKMYGQSRIRQEGIPVEAGKTYRVALQLRTNSDDTIKGTGNSLKVKVDFLNKRGRVLEGGMVNETVADRETVEDQWLPMKIVTSAPANAVTARVTITFVRSRNREERGAVWIDAVSMHAVDGVAVSPTK